MSLPESAPAGLDACWRIATTAPVDVCGLPRHVWQAAEDELRTLLVRDPRQADLQNALHSACEVVEASARDSQLAVRGEPVTSAGRKQAAAEHRYLAGVARVLIRGVIRRAGGAL